MKGSDGKKAFKIGARKENAAFQGKMKAIDRTKKKNRLYALSIGEEGEPAPKEGEILTMYSALWGAKTAAGL